jgi:hypothetical protein
MCALLATCGLGFRYQDAQLFLNHTRPQRAHIFMALRESLVSMQETVRFDSYHMTMNSCVRLGRSSPKMSRARMFSTASAVATIVSHESAPSILG